MKDNLTHSEAIKRRLIATACVPVVIALGLACKRYRGPGHGWVNDFGPASIAYEWLLMLLLFACVPRKSCIRRIAWAVFAGTCLIEFSQLCQQPWLIELRRYRIVQLAIGTSFHWGDFPAYAVGCLLGTVLLRAIYWVGSSSDDHVPNAV